MDSINSAISRYIYCIPGKWNIHLANGDMKHICDLEQKDVLATDGPGINEIIELKTLDSIDNMDSMDSISTMTVYDCKNDIYKSIPSIPSISNDYMNDDIKLRIANIWYENKHVKNSPYIAGLTLHKKRKPMLINNTIKHLNMTSSDKEELAMIEANMILPNEYVYNDYKVRSEVLNGFMYAFKAKDSLIDTVLSHDAKNNKRDIIFSQYITDDYNINQIITIAKSLGHLTTYYDNLLTIYKTNLAPVKWLSSLDQHGPYIYIKTTDQICINHVLI
jgi:hypothetical protein